MLSQHESKYQFFFFVALGCSFTVISVSSSVDGNVELLQQDEHFSDLSFADPIMPSFGTLHTLDKLIYWSRNEEEIYSVLHKKMRLIMEEYGLINK